MILLQLPLLLLLVTGALAGPTCDPYTPCTAAGECCSRWGWCGTGDDYCNSQSIQPAPAVTPILTTTMMITAATTCSATHPCPVDQCCSQHGWCGTGDAYCNSQSIRPNPPLKMSNPLSVNPNNLNPITDLWLTNKKQNCAANGAFLVQGPGLNSDLNQGAKGAYIYLCANRDPLKGDPIYDVLLTSSYTCPTTLQLDGQKEAQNTYFIRVPATGGLNGDLNERAGGATIIMCYTRHAWSSKSPLVNISLREFNAEPYGSRCRKPLLSGSFNRDPNLSDVVDLHFSTWDGSNSQLNGDLNQGSGGKNIYLWLTWRDSDVRQGGWQCAPFSGPSAYSMLDGSQVQQCTGRAECRTGGGEGGGGGGGGVFNKQDICMLNDSTLGLGVDEVDTRLAIATQYAPVIVFHPDEIYFPSSVDDFLDNVYLDCGDGDQPPGSQLMSTSGKWCVENCWLQTLSPLSKPTSQLPLFAGTRPDADNPPPIYVSIYSTSDTTFIAEYHAFFPYNQGKNICNSFAPSDNCIGARTMMDNHVGDWEGVANEFRLVFDGNSNSNKWQLTRTYVGAHSDPTGWVYTNGDVDLDWVPGPKVYSALGSHGLWGCTGAIKYDTLGTQDALYDRTGLGAVWTTNQNIQLVALEGVPTAAGQWLKYPGRWGNRHMGKNACQMAILAHLIDGADLCDAAGIPLDEYELNDGPTTPKITAAQDYFSGNAPATKKCPR